MLVKIIPTSTRAKNRVKEHGVIMRLVTEKKDSFLVESLENSFQLGGSKVPWLGWFTEKEASFIKLIDKE